MKGCRSSAGAGGVFPYTSMLVSFKGRMPCMHVHVGSQGLPLLTRMTLDVPERGEYFWSALQSFASRTCYANTCRCPCMLKKYHQGLLL
eukprot:1161930-Pelagomonas_calceolata.AAC.4